MQCLRRDTPVTTTHPWLKQRDATLKVRHGLKEKGAVLKARHASNHNLPRVE